MGILAIKVWLPLLLVYGCVATVLAAEREHDLSAR
jgi:hypothetical protein